jgi:uncharacterized membrane protein
MPHLGRAEHQNPSVSHHRHEHGGHAPITSGQARRGLAGIVGVIALVALVGMLLLRPSGDRPEIAEELGMSSPIVDATVTRVTDLPCAGTEGTDGIRCQVVDFQVTSGSTEGAEASLESPITDSSVDFDAGDRITLVHQADSEAGFEYFFNDFQRRTPLWMLTAAFAVAVLALGRFQGLRALLALGVTGVVMVGFMFPSILDGHDPTAVALVAAAVIAIAALYLTHGITELITVALLGTFAALALTAILAAVFSNLAQFSGFASEDAFYLTIASADIDIRGLVLAGIIIGSLGVLDDVTVTQVSAIWQLHEANPTYSARQLYASGVVIGRDHIASTVNTLVLAYAGASLPLLLVFTQAGRSLSAVAEGELVAVEIVRTLVGSIGLVAAVPITTALAAFVVTRGSGLTQSPPSGPRRRRPLSSEPVPRSTRAEPDWDQFAPGAPGDW